MKDMLTNQAYDDLFRIAKTTSRNATAKIPENLLVDEFKLEDIGNQQQYCFVGFKNRSLCNQILRSIYKLLRIFYNSLWFYFLPFFALLGTYGIPWIINI